MIIVRPLKKSDSEAFINIAFGAVGMTSMPKNKEKLLKRLDIVEHSFAKEAITPTDESYLFVLEDLETGVIGGTSGIVAQAARHSPLFFYRVEYQEKHENIAHHIRKVPTMRPVQYRHYWSEICSLYIVPDARQKGAGKLLSLSRFLFIADHPHRFTKKIFAEMRGVFDNNLGSPFWDGIGRHFIESDFHTLMQIRDEGTVDLTQALPTHPIYIEMLPPHVQASIGQVHPESKPALDMLLREGFNLSQECDICDGGPKIEADVSNIRTIKESTVAIVSAITQEEPCEHCSLISNCKIDFRACLAPVNYQPGKGVVISSKTAEALHILKGERVRWLA